MTKRTLTGRPRPPHGLRSNVTAFDDKIAGMRTAQRSLSQPSNGCNRIRGLGCTVRPESRALTALACAGMITIYIGLKLNLKNRLNAVPAPLRRAAQLLAGAVCSRLRPLRAPQHAADRTSSPPHTTCTISDQAAGYRTYLVALPPKRPSQAHTPHAVQPTTDTQIPQPTSNETTHQTTNTTCARTSAVSSGPPHGIGAREQGTGAPVDSRDQGMDSTVEGPVAGSAGQDCSPHGGSPDSEAPLEVHLLELARLSDEGLGSALGGLRAALQQAGGAVVGLDAEWEPELAPGVRHRVSVIQIASATACWILQPGPPTAEQPPADPSAQTSATPDAVGMLPDEIVQLLTDPRVIKAGVGIQEDVRRLARDFGVQIRGAVDVRLVAQCVAPDCLAAGSSLRAMTATLLGRALDKSPQRSHWGAHHLDERQVAYAAHDAWLSREVLLELFRIHQHKQSQQGQDCERSSPPERIAGSQSQLSGPPPPPPPVGNTEDIHTFTSAFLDVFNGIKPKRMDKALGELGSAAGGARRRAAEAAVSGRVVKAAGIVGGAASRAMSDGQGEEGSGGGSRRRKERKLPTRKSVLYENCRLLAPDGAVLCTCSAKKVRWYVERGLARVIAENPTTIQLNFEPRGRGHADDEYYLSDKENRCCVCGAGGEYLRHSVVPHCYRQHFPTPMKSHLSHDIVLLCPPCHKTCSAADQRRMEVLASELHAPLGAATAAKFRHDSNLGAVRSAGRALINTKVVIPPGRREELESLLRVHFGVEQLDGELIAAAANVDPRTEDKNWRSHAEQVVRALSGRVQLEAFIRGWRQHFLASMCPRYLPPHWRVDARVANSAADGAEDGEGAA